MGGLPDHWDAEKLTQLGQSVRETPARPSSPGYLTRWLHGPKYTDIFVDVAPGGDIDRVEITFAGHFLLWQAGKPLLTGQTDEMAVREETAPQSRFVQEHNQSDERIVNAVRILVTAISDQLLAEKLLALLPAPPTPESTP